MKLMPFSSQVAASSSSMLRDASAISIVPSHSRANAVTGARTVDLEYWTSGFGGVEVGLPTIELMGSTVDDPEITISPAPSP